MFFLSEPYFTLNFTLRNLCALQQRSWKSTTTGYRPLVVGTTEPSKGYLKYSGAIKRRDSFRIKGESFFTSKEATLFIKRRMKHSKKAAAGRLKLIFSKIEFKQRLAWKKSSSWRNSILNGLVFVIYTSILRFRDTPKTSKACLFVIRGLEVR